MSMVIFWAFLMGYLMFASIFITVKSVQAQLSDPNVHFTVSQLFSNPLFATLIVSLLSTWVMYLIASILFFDPWHMITCVSGPSISYAFHLSLTARTSSYSTSS